MVKKKRVLRKKTSASISPHKKCPHCNNHVSDLSTFCHHCGAHLVPPKAVHVHHCPSCHGVIEGFSRYCKHCGANVDTFHHGKFVKVLLYFIVFLILALALLIFFSPTLVNLDYNYNTAGSEIHVAAGTKESFLKVNNAICNWEDDSFKLCATVNWKGGTSDYIQCSFGGNLEDKKLYSSPVTCCSNVGTQEGVKLARAFLFNDDGSSYKDDALSATCVGKPQPKTTVVPKETKTNVQKKFWFTAKPTTTPTKGSGTIYVDFLGKVKSCEIKGRWVTKTNSIKGEAYCLGGEGVYYGNLDLFEQSVFSDPMTFIWAGPEKHYFDPEGQMHNGQSVYLDLCDPQYMIKPRYYISGIFSGLETNQLALDWKYFSNYPRPDVDVFVELDCKLI